MAAMGSAAPSAKALNTGGAESPDLIDSDDEMFELHSPWDFDKKKLQAQDDCINFSIRKMQCHVDDVMARSCSLKGLINTREALRLLQTDNPEEQGSLSTQA